MDRLQWKALQDHTLNMRSTSTIPHRQGFALADDGLQIYWKATGQGPAIVCCNGVGVSTRFWKYAEQQLSDRCTVVCWDYRGHGRSSPVARGGRVDIPRMARDLGAVVAALGLEKPLFMGHSMGTQVLLERCRQAPEEPGGVISVLGTAGYPLDTFGGLAASRQIFDFVFGLNDAFPRTMDLVVRSAVALPIAFGFAKRAGLVDGSRLSRHDLREYLHHLADMGAPLFLRCVEALGEHTAWDVLPRVACPALVVAGEFDGFTPPDLARKLHEGLPDSRWLFLEGASHAGIVEQPERINEAVSEFLVELGLVEA
jgi:pimeloyl-ACP methyl ester carboxylesterase